MDFARKHLTEQTLLVFRMRHIDGMKYQEIADRLGISRVMVYKHLTKAMTVIKEYQHQLK
jgi:RNA polymerase sigma-70 factor (ECF subfamily)